MKSAVDILIDSYNNQLRAAFEIFKYLFKNSSAGIPVGNLKENSFYVCLTTHKEYIPDFLQKIDKDSEGVTWIYSLRGVTTAKNFASEVVAGPFLYNDNMPFVVMETL